MAGSMFIKVTFLAIIGLVLVIPLTNAGQTCGQIQASASPCLPYITHQEPTVTETCCNGIRTVNDQVRTVAERKYACECIKSSFSLVPGLDPYAAQRLPNKCNIKPSFPIGANVDCSKITVEL